MNKRLVFWIKVIFLVTVLGFIVGTVWKNWHELENKHVTVTWRWGIPAVLALCLNMLTASLIWRWIARRMAARARVLAGSTDRSDHLPTLRLIGAYTFSQMGKYIPGKIALLLMRMDRAARFGMPPRIATLSTILENALYMISGGLVGIVAILRLATDLENEKHIPRAVVWIGTLGAMAVLAMGCYPPIFYGLVNRILKKMKKPEVPRQEWLGLGTLIKGVLGFIPCWIFGGFAIWATVNALQPVPLLESWWLAGAFALSVIIGMASLLPGGAGVREAVLFVAIILQLESVGVPHARAVILATAATALQRLFQVIAEILMGALGAALTTTPTSTATVSER